MKSPLAHAFRVLFGSALLFASGLAAAETLTEYVASCKRALEISTIPGYKCTDGKFVSKLTGRPGLPSNNNYIGKVDTGNPNVDAIFLCRDYNSTTQTTGLNGYILQNRVNGNTCFFDAQKGKSQTSPAIDSTNASTHWAQPQGMDGLCVDCHTADPYIVTPALATPFAQLQLMYNGRNLKGPYKVVNTSLAGSHFNGWEGRVNTALKNNTDNCSDACHRLAKNSFSEGTAAFPGMNPDAKTKGWMPPDVMSGYHVTDRLVYNTNFFVQNYWASDWKLNIQSGSIEASSTETYWHSAHWTFEKVGDYYRIKNRWKPTQFLHISHDNFEIKSGPILSGWWSAQWTLIPVTDVAAGYKGKTFRIQNRWKPAQYLHVQNGFLEAGPAEATWWSGWWVTNEI